MREGSLVVGSFNVHCGVDGWARRFDVVGACASIAADVLVLEESWAPDGEPSTARRVAGELGYGSIEEVELSRASVLDEEPGLTGSSGPPSWGPPPGIGFVPRALRLEPPQAGGARRAAAHRYGRARASRSGSWGVALLSRVPVRRMSTIELRRLRRDPVRRLAVVAELETGLTVVGVHLAHLEHGSVLQMRHLAGELGQIPGPLVLTGDMNSWSFPLLMLLPGFSRAVRGRTWPAWAPHSQIDHLLVAGGASVLSGEVLEPLGSDHRAVRACVALPGAVLSPPAESRSPRRSRR